MFLKVKPNPTNIDTLLTYVLFWGLFKTIYAENILYSSLLPDEILKPKTTGSPDQFAISKWDLMILVFSTK